MPQNITLILLQTIELKFQTRFLEVAAEVEDLLGSVDSDSTLGVLSHSLLEEVGLSLEGDHLHPLEGVGGFIHLGDVEGGKETVGAELNVLAHHGGVHADELYGEGVGDELLLDGDSVADDVLDSLVGELVHEVAVHHACEVAVEA